VLWYACERGPEVTSEIAAELVETAGVIPSLNLLFDLSLIILSAADQARSA